MMDPSDAAGSHGAECDVDVAQDVSLAPGERRLRPLQWLSGPADREQDLRTWLDYRRTMIGSARAERLRR